MMNGDELARRMLAHEGVLLTDTSMRDAHQSLLATRMRTADMVAIGEAYDALGLFSVECWGGATFDVALRFLRECPWERLHLLREAMPRTNLQMLLRGANAVGYGPVADNVVREFVRLAARDIDIFRVFDCMNDVENMRLAMEAVREAERLCEGAICYTQRRPMGYYADLARRLAQAGAHVICIKDMAGLVKPQAARALVRMIKEETGLAVHFHTHDTSGGAVASVLAAVEAGADAVDGAMDALSGLTSQPNLGTIVEMLEGASGVDANALRDISDYWEKVRGFYAAFESDMRAGASEVYVHEMPGGQFTNLKEQARAMGLAGRWHEVARAYAEVNAMFGDIVKVTPSSKAVGDMALAMVSAGWSREDVEGEKEVFFPDSVVAMMRGELGMPEGGFPKALQAKVLAGEAPLQGRAGAALPPVDLVAAKAQVEKEVGRAVSEEDVLSWVMYPRQFVEYAKHRRQYGPVSILPTPVFFHGMGVGEEISVDLEPGKTLVIQLQAIGDVDDSGMRRVFFELNGQARVVRVRDESAQVKVAQRVQADAGNVDHVAAPMPGTVVSVSVKAGQKVRQGDVLLAMEAMKMETMLHAERDGVIGRVHVSPGEQVEAKDLLLEYRGR